eukprot:TRINITY_DN8398_c0_g1_i4.p1 TRINITY_DN8398_c0_g1~~TRINITY_DN8398_c0_g1_i4.p1  ORF type:complete len:450 (+),score=71.72 TRINITY_DN8398_c0_g1_i4:263-1612(+)
MKMTKGLKEKDDLNPTIVELLIWRDLFGPLFGSFCTSEVAYLLSKEDEKYQPLNRISIQNEAEMWKFVQRVKVVYQYLYEISTLYAEYFSLTAINRKKLREMRLRLKIYRHMDSIGRKVPKRKCWIVPKQNTTTGVVKVYFEAIHKDLIPKNWDKVQPLDLRQGQVDPDNKLGVDVLAWFFGNGFGFLQELRNMFPHLPGNGWSKSLDAHLNYLDSKFDAQAPYDGNLDLAEIEERIDSMEFEDYNFRADPRVEEKDIPKEEIFSFHYETPHPIYRKAIMRRLYLGECFVYNLDCYRQLLDHIDKSKFYLMMDWIFEDFNSKTFDNGDWRTMVHSLKIKPVKKSIKLIEGRMNTLRKIVKEKWANLSELNIDTVIAIVVNSINHQKPVNLANFQSELGQWIRSFKGRKPAKRTQTDRKADNIETQRSERMKKLKTEEDKEAPDLVSVEK